MLNKSSHHSANYNLSICYPRYLLHGRNYNDYNFIDLFSDRRTRRHAGELCICVCGQWKNESCSAAKYIERVYECNRNCREQRESVHEAWRPRDRFTCSSLFREMLSLSLWNLATQVFRKILNVRENIWTEENDVMSSVLFSPGYL